MTRPTWPNVAKFMAGCGVIIAVAWEYSLPIGLFLVVAWVAMGVPS